MKKLTMLLFLGLLLAAVPTHADDEDESDFGEEHRSAYAAARDAIARRIVSNTIAAADRKIVNKYRAAPISEPAVVIPCPSSGGIASAAFGRRHAMVYHFGSNKYKMCMERTNTPGFISTLVEATGHASAKRRLQEEEAAKESFLEDDSGSEVLDGDEAYAEGEALEDGSDDEDESQKIIIDGEGNVEGQHVLLLPADSMIDEEEEAEIRGNSDPTADLLIAEGKGRRMSFNGIFYLYVRSKGGRPAYWTATIGGSKIVAPTRKGLLEKIAKDEQEAEVKRADAVMDAVGNFDNVGTGTVPAILFTPENIACGREAIGRIRNMFPGDKAYLDCINNIKGMQPDAAILAEQSASQGKDLLISAGSSDGSDAWNSRHGSAGYREGDLLITDAKGFVVHGKGFTPGWAAHAIAESGTGATVTVGIGATPNVSGVRYNAAAAPPRCGAPKRTTVGFIEGKADSALLTLCVHQASMKHHTWEKKIAKETNKIRLEARNPLLRQLPHINRLKEENTLRAMIKLKAQSFIQKLLEKFEATYLGARGKRVDLERVHEERNDPAERDPEGRYVRSATWAEKGGFLGVSSKGGISDSVQTEGAIVANPVAPVEDGGPMPIVGSEPTAEERAVTDRGIHDDVSADSPSAALTDASLPNA